MVKAASNASVGCSRVASSISFAARSLPLYSPPHRVDCSLPVRSLAHLATNRCRQRQHLVTAGSTIDGVVHHLKSTARRNSSVREVAENDERNRQIG